MVFMVIAHLHGAPAKSREPARGREPQAATRAPPAQLTRIRPPGSPPDKIFDAPKKKWAGPRAGKLWKTHAALQSIRLRNPG
jgi:hypothetical protein